MKSLHISLAVLACVLAVVVDQARAGVSVSIGEPGFYGRIDIGGYPAPRLIYPEPIIVHRVRTWYPPIYLRVAPYHVSQWYRYCSVYGACGRPVYFIDDGWYREVYIPRYHWHRHHYHDRRPPPPYVYRPPHYYDYKKFDNRPPRKIYPDATPHWKGRDHHGDGRYQHKKIDSRPSQKNFPNNAPHQEHRAYPGDRHR